MARNTSNRGFASMDEDTQRQIASEGGQNSPANFKNDRRKAKKAGQKSSRKS
jgi:general stress protein YciG